ncbi:MAG TPA: tail fiber protein [Solirubrobacteraceae bacterium]|jgi:hypothetical protein
MRNRIRRNLTYANVMSSIACFFALAGGAAYAANEWTGANIQDGTLTWQDVAPSTLGGGRVADNSLTGADVLESSLAKVPDADKLDGKDSSAFAGVGAGSFANRFGNGGGAVEGATAASECVLTEIVLVANHRALPEGFTPARGQELPINQNQALFALLETNYGGNGQTTFKLPDMRPIEPDHMTYGICTTGVFPSTAE